MADTSSSRQRRFLFVDDDESFLEIMRELFVELSRGTWEIFTARNHAEMLAQLQRQRMDLVVLDVGMPIMDGVQLLRLIARTHPGQQVVMLTGNITEETRKTCLDNGAVLFLQKPASRDDFAAIHSALDALASARGGEGFQGVMQRVGLNEVLQFECLGQRSSLLEVFTGKVRGNIYISDGAIVHAESGTLQGEVALYGLLALRGGGFNLLPFREPPRRSIQGPWEMLLMEAARLSDEAAHAAPTEPAEAPLQEVTPGPEPDVETMPAVPASAPAELPPARIAEVVLCSGACEVLYDWECSSLEKRLALMDQIEQQASRVSELAPVGRFDRLEVTSVTGRLVCQIQPHRRLLVRSAPLAAEVT